MPVEIIAEAGCNHNGQLNLALVLVDQAKFVGADVVKFQTAVPEFEVTASAPLAPYQCRPGGPSTQLEMIRGLTLSFHETLKVARHCEAVGIEFMSTPADVMSLRFLVDECGVRRLKIGSGDITNVQLLASASAADLPLLISTGMATMDEIVAVGEYLGWPQSLTLMHCTSCYPTALVDANVRAITALTQQHYVARVGFSDHTPGSAAAQLAVALGASVIEKHLTLDCGMEGPDHAASLDPADFVEFIADIRRAEIALGSGEKVPCAAEMRNAPMVRKSLVAAAPIRAGEEFSSTNLTVKRPGTGRSPWDYFELMGKPARRDYDADDLIVD